MIHTVGPVWHGGGNHEPELLASCYETALNLAESRGIKSIAFPCISTGVYRYPKEEAARIALSVILKHIESGKYNGRVVICCFSSRDAQIYDKCLESL